MDASCKTFVEGLRKEGKEDDEIEGEKEKYIKENWRDRFGNWSKKQWLSKYNDLQRHLIEDYLARNPEIMQQQILVFPINHGGGHWMSTFVFNRMHTVE